MIQAYNQSVTGTGASGVREPGVAVIIVNYNGGEVLEHCLRAVEAQTLRPRRVIVVDNASHDGSVEGITARHPAVEVIRCHENWGFAKGNNLGIAAADECGWIACLNPYAFPKPDWLARLITAAEAHPQFAFFGCRLVQAEHPDRLDGTGDVYHVSGLTWRRDHRQRVEQGTLADGEIFAPSAAAALYRRADVLAVGGFDESYFCYIEDIDLAFRLRLAGHRGWYVSDAIVHHVGSAIAGTQSDFAVYHGHRNLVWTYFKNMPAELLWRYLLLHLLLNLVTILVFAERGKAGVIFRAKWDALKGLRKMLQARQAVQASRRVDAAALRGVMTQGLGALYRQWRASLLFTDF
jgi:GT2 family glycosyltransferase